MTSMPDTDVVEITRDLLTTLFGSQMESARRLHFHERTVRWWCQHGAPPHVLRVLDRLRRDEISLRWARQLLRTKRTRRPLNGGRSASA
jgi:23S rRNA A1618 N6-methylase RlmF